LLDFLGRVGGRKEERKKMRRKRKKENKREQKKEIEKICITITIACRERRKNIIIMKQEQNSSQKTK
jgi:hypothetical protein